jgi:3-hydroxyisobutyrate dehydrogenase/glyoxylate/succinic semialdehyde reductase
MKTGFMGLGIMGSRMAMNLLRKKYDIIVYNRTKEKAAELLDSGAEWAETAAEAAEQSDIFITMLSTPEVVNQTALGENGFLPAMKKGAIWMNSTTVNPSFAEEMASKAEEYGIRYLDAPVAGSLKPAESGDLIFLVGGDQIVVDKYSAMFEIMGKKYVHAGPAGKGSALKMVINMMLGYSMAAFSEAVHLGNSLGIDKERLLEFLPNLAVIAPFVKSKAGNMSSGEYKPEFPLKWMQKDMHLAALSAYEQGISIPGENAVKELYARALQEGLGDEDMSAVFKSITRK